MSVARIPDEQRGGEAAGRLQRRSLAVAWLLLGLLGLITLVALLGGHPTTLELLQAALIISVAVALLIHRRFEAARLERRDGREASFGRLLQGLSRSVSPQSVVDAIVQELCIASGADHVVVARLRNADHVLETTLVSAREAVPSVRAYLPASVLDPAEAPVGRESLPRVPSRQRRQGGGHRSIMPTGAAKAAEEVARRVRADYGLRDTLAAPLVADGRIVGALVISRRAGRAWSDASDRLLDWAAEEVSLALARANAFETIEQQANMDSLTALPNRRYFDQLAGVMHAGRRAGDSIGVLMVDIDRFKSLNDRFGHAAGDRVLRLVADAIARSIRAEDTPARYGGEEFAVLLKRATPEQAAEVAERVRSAVVSLTDEELGVSGPVSVSVGVAVGGPGMASFSELVERADTALYAAKHRGRDRVVVA